MEPHPTRSWSVVAVPANVPGLRAAVCQYATESGVHDPPLENVRLAVSEAITNVVLHGYRDDPAPGSVRVDAAIHPTEFRLVVADTGLGMSPRTDSPGAGFGIPLMAAVADAYEVCAAVPTGTEVHLGFDLP